MPHTGSQSIRSVYEMTFEFRPQRSIKAGFLFQRSNTLGAGVRYDINDRYSLPGGLNYKHISNGYLSQPAFYNDRINVYGLMFGFDMRLGKPRHHGSSE